MFVRYAFQSPQPCAAGTYKFGAGTSAALCIACDAGKRSASATGSSSCTDCGSATFLAVVSAATKDTCDACAGNGQTPNSPVRDSCICDAGYYGIGTTAAGTCTVTRHFPDCTTTCCVHMLMLVPVACMSCS
jgi:hypothetical protein